MNAKTTSAPSSQPAHSQYWVFCRNKNKKWVTTSGSRTTSPIVDNLVGPITIFHSKFIIPFLFYTKFTALLLIIFPIFLFYLFYFFYFFSEGDSLPSDQGANSSALIFHFCIRVGLESVCYNSSSGILGFEF